MFGVLAGTCDFEFWFYGFVFLVCVNVLVCGVGLWVCGFEGLVQYRCFGFWGVWICLLDVFWVVLVGLWCALFRCFGCDLVFDGVYWF